MSTQRQFYKNVSFLSTDNSSSNTTGSVVINGGLGILGNINVGGSATISNLNVSNVSMSDSTISNLLTTNITSTNSISTNVLATTSTISNSVFTNITSNNLNLTNTINQNLLGTSGNSAFTSLIGDLTNDNTNGIVLGKTTTTNESSVIRFVKKATTNYCGIGFWANDDILNVSANGNVGIGTITPSVKLDVNGTISATFISSGNLNITGNITVSNILATTSTILNSVFTNISSGTLSANSSTIPNSVFTNISSGTVSANSSTIPNSVFTNISSNTSIITNSVFTNVTSNSLNLTDTITQYLGGTNSKDALLSLSVSLDNDNSNALVFGRTSALTNEAAVVRFVKKTTNNYIGLGFIANDDILNVSANGNVGIGTITPGFKLDVNGSFRVQSNINGNPNAVFIQNSNAGSSAYSILSIGNNTGNVLSIFLNSSTRTNDGGVNTATIRNDSGSIRLQPLGANGLTIASTTGIASFQSPNQVLTIAGTNEDQTVTLNFGTNFLGDISVSKTAIICQGLPGFSRSKMHFCLDNNTNNNVGSIASLANARMTIQPDGNVGIGTVSPGVKLHVFGGILSDSSNDITTQGAHLLWNRSGIDGETWLINTTIGSNPGIRFGKSTLANSVTELMRIQDNGNVGIGTTTPRDILEVQKSNASITISGVTESDDVALKFRTPNSNIDAKSAIICEGLLNWSRSKMHFCLDNTEDHAITSVANLSNARMTIQPDGNVGIGTTTPQAKLDISSRLTAVIRLSGDSANTMADTGAISSQIQLRHDGGSNGYNINLLNFVGTSALNIASFDLTETSRIYINESGNVGIGTTTPNAPLQLSNTLANRKLVLFEVVNNDHRYFGLGVNDDTFRYQVNTTTDSHVFYAGTSNTTSNELMKIQGNGNVGIGTSTPGSSLHVAGSIPELPLGDGVHIGRDPGGWGKIQLNGSPGGYIDFSTSGMDFKGRILYDNSLNTMRFYTNITETMTMVSNGNIGIGTTTPNCPLQFANTLVNRKIVLLEVANNDHQYIGFGVNNDTFRYQINAITDSHVFYVGMSSTTSNELMRIQGNGNVGIGTSTPGDLLQVSNVMLMASSGDLTVTGDVLAFGTISDARLKTNVQDISSGLETISNLRPVTFNWKDDIFNEKRRGESDSGFIAQEVEQVIPHAVGEYNEIESGELYKNMRHERIIPYLVKAIQELNLQVIELSNKLQELQK